MLLIFAEPLTSPFFVVLHTVQSKARCIISNSTGKSHVDYGNDINIIAAIAQFTSSCFIGSSKGLKSLYPCGIRGERFNSCQTMGKHAETVIYLGMTPFSVFCVTFSRQSCEGPALSHNGPPLVLRVFGFTGSDDFDFRSCCCSQSCCQQTHIHHTHKNLQCLGGGPNDMHLFDFCGVFSRMWALRLQRFHESFAA